MKGKYTIRIHADDIEIREKTFATYVSGQHFGESALYSNEKRTGTVVALTTCDIDNRIVQSLRTSTSKCLSVSLINRIVQCLHV